MCPILFLIIKFFIMLYKIYPVGDNRLSNTALAAIGEYSLTGKRIQVAGTTYRPGNTNNGVLWERLDAPTATQPSLSFYGFPFQNSGATALNNVYPSQVVAWVESQDKAGHLPFLFEKSGNTILDTLGGNAGEANGINDNGIIAGWSLNPNGYRRATVWQSRHNLIDLGTLGGNESVAFAINKSGQVAGWAEDANGSMHAFLWTPGGTDGIAGNPQMKDIHLAGFAVSLATALNDNGDVVGQLQQPTDEAFFKAANGAVKVLPNLGYTAVAKGINNNGEIVGQSQAAVGSPIHGVTWFNFLIEDLNDQLVDKDSFFTITDATAINSGGYIAARARTSGLNAFPFGLILDPFYLHFQFPYMPDTQANWSNGFPGEKDMNVLTGMLFMSARLHNKKRKHALKDVLLEMIEKNAE